MGYRVIHCHAAWCFSAANHLELRPEVDIQSKIT